MIETIRQGLRAEGMKVSISKLCEWFAVPRRTVNYRPIKAVPMVNNRFPEPIDAMIEEHHRLAIGWWRTYSIPTRTRCSGSVTRHE